MLRSLADLARYYNAYGASERVYEKASQNLFYNLFSTRTRIANPRGVQEEEGAEGGGGTVARVGRQAIMCSRTICDNVEST